MSDELSASATQLRLAVPAKQKGLRRLYAATGYSLAGLVSTYRKEEAFRVELWVLAVLGPLALWLGETAVEKVLLLASLVLVILCELVNTGLERVVDRIGPEHHELSGQAKDVGSATVLISIALAVLTWALLLI